MPQRLSHPGTGLRQDRLFMIVAAEDLDGLASVAAAVIDPTGALVTANRGFLRLLGEGGEYSRGAAVGRFFIQPDFATLSGATPSEGGELYRGMLTIGEYSGKTRTLRGKVWRAPEGLCLLA